MKSFLSSAILLLAFVAVSCTNSTEYQADQLSISQLASQPGYAWFPAEVNRFTPSQASVDSIRVAYASSPFTTYLYVNPSCTCSGTQKHFPHLYSTLKAAGIPDSSMVVYSMLNAATPHPNSDKFTVTVLPTFFFVRGSDIRKLVPPVDSLTRVDSLIANIVK